MLLHTVQKKIASSLARFKVIRAGRKGGKTSYEIENIGHKSQKSAKYLNLTKTSFPTGRKVLYIAPTKIQAKDIIWESLKRRFHGVAHFDEQLKHMRIPNEDDDFTTVYVGGWENRENYRGLTDVTHITFDEVDTLRDFFISWLEIFRPMFLDTGGSADFIGTPKKENPNLRRLEKDFIAKGDGFECFQFTSKDNPFLSVTELSAMESEYKNDMTSYRQEILAEYIDDQGALFHYDALVDVFSNTVTKENESYLTVDVATDGSDKCIFSFWQGLEEYKREEFAGLKTENIIDKIREYAAKDRIPYSHIAVDAIGNGDGVASSSLLDGIIGYKSSYMPIKTDISPVYLPNVGVRKDAPLVTDYKNLRSQCVFELARLINTHKIASRVTGKQKEAIIEELSNYQDASLGDGKRMATPKEKIKEIIGHSPDSSDTWIMRMYFIIRKRMSPVQSEEVSRARTEQKFIFSKNKQNQSINSNK